MLTHNPKFVSNIAGPEKSCKELKISTKNRSELLFSPT